MKRKWLHLKQSFHFRNVKMFSCPFESLTDKGQNDKQLKNWYVNISNTAKIQYHFPTRNSVSRSPVQFLTNSFFNNNNSRFFSIIMKHYTIGKVSSF